MHNQSSLLLGHGSFFNPKWLDEEDEWLEEEYEDYEEDDDVLCDTETKFGDDRQNTG